MRRSDSIDVEGATGNIHTNYVGKASMQALKKGKDFVYLHAGSTEQN